MSAYLYTTMTVTGNAKILRDFVKYFENDYDGNGAWYASHEGDGFTHDFLNDNCYCIEGMENHFVFDLDTLSREFPCLKFENIVECSDEDVSDFSIYINGKQLDNAEGNSLAFGPCVGDEEKCKLCNTSVFWDNKLCEDCKDFRSTRIYKLFETGLMTFDEYYDKSSSNDLEGFI